MIQTDNTQVKLKILKDKISAVYQYLMEQNETENADKVKQLAQKLIHKEFAIAFCGHFSAGKSRMINCLVGENLLPSSPIPTSANLVKVRAGGSEYVKVYFKDAKPRLYQAPYDYQLVKNYCKDGDQIKAIEISHSDLNLPSQTVILDTPGIDSADDAHRIATESAIHLADLIFYVMDYNHVQAELNFMFTKELTEAGKEVYLIINQVDKHSDQELDFIDFKKSVINSFASWGVKPADIFYTSLKDSEHEHNQFSILQDFLAKRLKQKDELLLNSLFISLQKIVNEFMHKKLVEIKLASEQFSNTLNELTDVERINLMDNYQQLVEREKFFNTELVTIDQYISKELAKIMQNAYLMPFATRALAESYLAASEPGFKVGFLFTKQKTTAERQQRLMIFYEDISDKTKSQLEWHLRNFLIEFIKEQSIDNVEILQLIQNFKVEFSPNILINLVKVGARLSDAYVINYTDSVANEIKKIAKVNLVAIKEIIYRELVIKNAEKLRALIKEQQNVKRYVEALDAIQYYEAAESALRKNILSLLNNNCASVASGDFNLFESLEEEFEIVLGGQHKESLTKVMTDRDIEKHTSNCKTTSIIPTTDRLLETGENLRRAAEFVHLLPGFAKIAVELTDKADRLTHKGFTVALFGAFSAGKSSFANALIGERVLPVSPNPTTAAINKIKPVDQQHRHGSVIIQLKSLSVMLADVNNALQLFLTKADSLRDAIAIIDKLILTPEQGVREKTNYTFLQAFKRGYDYFHNKLGTRLSTTIAEFSDYVAQEEKSCFIEWIDLYYDCPLTQMGITLVDTPGADSINARHTGVAFEFIKNADAILFVTYYNHAFSKADREFLIQLGRVKDSFHLDKMFFIINAIDLAEDDNEKMAVVEYVQEQLVKYGVKKPHLYPLSSLQALQEKQSNSETGTSGMVALEEKFYQFITHDLADLAIVAAELEVQRVSELVEQLIITSKEDTDVKAEKRQNIASEKELLRELFAQQKKEVLQHQLNQEIAELIYYIKQRVFLRFTDFFKESFNPTILRDDGRNLKKVLNGALAEFIGQIGFDFSQEMRATTVRLDCFAQRLIVEYQKGLVIKNQQINSGLSFTLFDWNNEMAIDFVPAFQEISQEIFTTALSSFKNPKAFFEKNESKIMSEALYHILSSQADKYLHNEQNRIQAYYNDIMDDQFTKLIEQMCEQVDDFYLGLLSALEGGLVTEDLVKIQQGLKNMYCDKVNA